MAVTHGLGALWQGVFFVGDGCLRMRLALKVMTRTIWFGVFGCKRVCCAMTSCFAGHCDDMLLYDMKYPAMQVFAWGVCCDVLEHGDGHGNGHGHSPRP